MAFSHFKLLSEVNNKDVFFTRIRIYKNSIDNVFWVDCDFAIHSFNINLYQQLIIHLPANINNSVLKRQAEFLSGRYIACLALMQLGFSKPPKVSIGDDRAPIWPDGIYGSITHNAKRAICILGENNCYLGIDIEDKLSDNAAQEIGSYVQTNDELALFYGSAISKSLAITIIFSAKESLFKAIYPQVNVYFDFKCAQLVDVDLNLKILTFKLSPQFCTQHQINDSYRVFFDETKSLVKTMVLMNR
jgi:enterobactin synthetase component D